MIVDLIRKIWFNIKYMFTEDKLAAAQIAQIFGSELLKVQKNSITDSDSAPDIVRLDPKSFLFDERNNSSNRKRNEQQIMQMLQQEAESACPLPISEPIQKITQDQPIVVSSAPSNKPSATSSLNNSTFEPFNNINVLERIASSLERIASAIEHKKVQVRTKRKSTKIKNVRVQ